MRKRKPRLKFWFSAVALLALLAYWVSTPHLALHAVLAAAQAGDAETFNRYVDYPKLRASLKAQFSQRLENAASAGNGAEKAGAAVGAKLAIAALEPMIDGLVKPEIVMRTLRPQTPPTAPARKPGAGAQPSGAKWAPRYAAINRFEVRPVPEADNAGASKPRAGFVLERESTTSDWRLTEILLPP